MLDSVEMVAKWYNDKSGDNLAMLFESFPTGRKESLAVPNLGVGNSGNTNPGPAEIFSIAGKTPDNKPFGKNYYEWLEENRANAWGLPANPFIGRCLRPLEPKNLDQIIKLSESSVKTMRALENILSAFQSVGSKFGDLDPQSQTFMTPGQMFNYLCDYVKASAFTTEFMPQLPLVTSSRYHSTMEEEKIDTGAGGVNVPANLGYLRPPTVNNALDTGTCVGYTGVAITQANQAVWSQDIAYMNSSYIKTSVGQTTRPGVKHGIVTGVSTEVQTPGNLAALNESDKYISLALAGIPADSKSSVCDTWTYHSSGIDGTDSKYRIDLAGWRDHFYDTDLLFTMTIKAIVAKVFTVVDAYRLFHRPATEKRTYMASAPVRTILGGAASVQVMPDALELYYRLPLLIEWYREQFKIDRDLNTANTEYVLTIAPTIDGVFGDLTQIICEDGGNITEGNYTETQVQRIIQEINTIWKAYKAKYPKATTRNIINAYVLDINRVLGFIRKDDIDKYLSNRRERYDTSGRPISSEENDFLDYDILNANGQYASNRAAPSDRFTSTNLLTGKTTSAQATVFLMKQIHEMRSRMDREFNRFVRSGGPSSINFSSTIHNYKSELDLAKDPAAEYKIVLRMMQGGNQLVQDDVDVMVMAHEAVAAPLATLYAVWRVMHKFNSTMHGVSLVNIGKWNSRRDNLAVAIVTNNLMYDGYQAYIGTEYKNTNGDMHHHFTTSLMGNYSDSSEYKCLDRPGNGNITTFNCGFIKAQSTTGKLKTNILKSDDMLRALLSMVLDLHSNTANLTSCSIGAGGNINIDLSPLRDTCVALLNNVKSNILALRTSFPNTRSLEKYENVKIPGTTRWIEENLMEVLFNDRDKCGLNTGITSHLIPTLNKLATSTGAAAGIITPGANATGESYGSMYDAFASMLFYKHSPVNATSIDHVRCNVNRFPFNIAITNASTYATDAKQLMNVDEVDLTIAGARTIPLADMNTILDIPQMAFCDYEHLDKFNPAYPVKSLLFTFNQFLRNYIYCNTDQGTLKTYLPLYESFAAGPAGYEVGQFKAFQDVFAMTGDSFLNVGVRNAECPYTAGNPLNLPGEKALVFNSNAILIRKILSSETQIGSVMKRKHLYESFAEIPETMRDKLKTNLPYFSKMLQQFYSRAEFLFKYLNNSKVKNNLERVQIANALSPAINNPKYKAAEFKNIAGAAPEPSASMAVYFSAQLTKFMELSLGLKKCADSVYKELNDKPFYYLETNKDFIVDYKSRTGNIPFMPASSLLAPLRMFDLPMSNWNDQTDSAGHLLLPVSETSSTVFKFNAGSKIIMARDDLEPSVDQMPGVKEIYNHYNSHAAGTKISAGDYATSVKNMVKLIRFLSNGAVYNRFYDTEAFSFDIAEGLNNGITLASLAANGGPGNGNLIVAFQAANNLSARYGAFNTTCDGGAAAGGAGAAVTFALIKSALNTFNARKYSSSGIFTNLHWRPYTAAIANGLRLAPGAGVQVATAQYKGTLYGPSSAADRSELTLVPLDVSLPQVLELTESTSIRFSKDLIMNTIRLGSGSNVNTSRADLRTSNILDMDIVPINVHAFMREVPFVNLMNYSYTFDRMAHEFINPEYYNSDDKPTLMPADAQINSTRELLVKLLVHPYADLGPDGKEYYALLASLFNGNDNMRLGIAKYLSDQLWHKVLLTSSVQLAAESGADFPSMEAGPAAYEATNAMIHYGTRVNTTHWASAASVKFILSNTTIQKVLTIADNAACNGGTPFVHNAAATIAFVNGNGTIIHAAGSAAANNVQIPNLGATLAANAALGNTLNGNGTGAQAVVPSSYIAAAGRIPNAYVFNNALSIKNISLANGGGDIKVFTDKLEKYVFQARGGGSNGGILWQAETARQIVDSLPFTRFIIRCSRVFLAEIRANNNANLATVALFHAAMCGGGPTAGAGVGADANNIGTGSHSYRRQARLDLVAAVANAQLTIQIDNQCNDVIHHGFFQDGTTPQLGNELYQILRDTQNRLDIDITTMNAVPNILLANDSRVGHNVAIDATHAGIVNEAGFTHHGCIAYRTQTFEGLHQNLHVNLPGVHAALNIFTEFLYLMKPFRQYAPLRYLAQTLFLLSLYRVDNDANAQATFAFVVENMPDNLPRWVKYFVQYMAVRMYSVQTIAGAAGDVFSLSDNLANANLAAAAVNAFANAGQFTPITQAPLTAGAAVNGSLTISDGTIPVRGYLIADFYMRMHELIALSYCNPIMIIDEIPRLLSDYGTSNAYLAIASLPNMTPGLKIRDKTNKNKWKVVQNGAAVPRMSAPEVIYCAEIGRARFDTKIVRNLTWFTQLQRVMRVVLTNHLSWINSPVVRGLKIADARMTELHGNDSYDPEAFTGESYKGQF
jgi:hypothetical protein